MDDALRYRLDAALLSPDPIRSEESENVWRSATFESGLVLARRGTTLAFVTADSVRVPEAMPPGKKVAWVREPYLLVTAEDGSLPRLYDGRTGAPLWQSDDALGVTFWPAPASPVVVRP